ncbi:hypothetical protein [Flavivirga spongiicola]|uniref:DUF3387 domain-containing protein n=1 Tax=Flavivirga spongiicola TaxID=421621 RepID=A0ABU7XXN9_9FLAO|nr:hypothetical protein [Flavivirga sp. MEBiC05379]MDO5980560.1 hypothetical protein [Flavivirga sp. MEBiC05379]
MKISNNQKETGKDINELIQRIENGESITPQEEIELHSWFDQVRSEISIAKNRNEKPQSFSKRKTITSQIIKYVGFKIICDQIEKILKEIFQEL